MLNISNLFGKCKSKPVLSLHPVRLPAAKRKKQNSNEDFWEAKRLEILEGK